MVFDDAVLHHCHLAITTAMGMGISDLRLAMGGPTGVTDAALPGSTIALQQRSKMNQFALGAKTGQLLISVNHSQTSGVIAAVLELTQTLKELWGGWP